MSARELGIQAGIHHTPGDFLNDEEKAKVERFTAVESNNEYYSNGYRYRTDELGRVKVAEGLLSDMPDGVRNLKAQTDVPEKLSTDHGGHIIAYSAGGANSNINLFAQDGNLNQGDYKKMELRSAKEIVEDKQVYCTVQLFYEGDSFRPSQLGVTNTVMNRDGESIVTHNYNFDNTTKENREAIEEAGREFNETATRELSERTEKYER